MNKSLGTYNIFDNKGINRSIENVLKSNTNFNTYTTPKGLKELRIEISKFLYRIWNYEVDYNNMLITTNTTSKKILKIPNPSKKFIFSPQLHHKYFYLIICL